MDETDRPELDLEVSPTALKWEPSKEIEEQVLEMFHGRVPTKLRATEAQLEEFYRIAINLYRAGNYKNALPFFHLLSTGRPQDGRFLRSIAACYQMLKEYTEAIAYYTASSVVEPENPFPFYYCADCWMRLNEPIGAYLSLDMGIKAAAENGRYVALLDRMVAMKRKLGKEFEEKKKLEAPLKGASTFGEFPNDMEEMARFIKDS